MMLQEDFKAFVDGEVPSGLALRIQIHLAREPEDQKIVDELQLLSKSIREYVTQPEPVGLEATLTALQEAKPVVQKKLMFRQQVAWVGGALACMLFLGLVGRGIRGLGAGGSYTRRLADGAVTTAAPMSLQPSAPVTISAGSSKAKVMDANPMPEVGGGSNSFANNGAVPRMQYPSDAGANGLRLQAGVPSASAPSPSGKVLVQPMIQRDATVSVEVDKVSDAQEKVETAVSGFGGYIEQENAQEADGEKGHATMTIRIPAQHFEDLLTRISHLGHVVSKSSSGENVTGQAVDMDARLKVLKTEENDYVSLLAHARSIGQIMELKDKLSDVREEIESITAQRATLKDQVQYSTVSLTLTQKDADNGPSSDELSPDAKKDAWLGDTWTSAITGLGSVAKVVAQLLIFALVWAPIWVPLSLLGAWSYRKMKW